MKKEEKDKLDGTISATKNNHDSKETVRLESVVLRLAAELAERLELAKGREVQTLVNRSQ